MRIIIFGMIVMFSQTSAAQTDSKKSEQEELEEIMKENRARKPPAESLPKPKATRPPRTPGYDASEVNEKFRDSWYIGFGVGSGFAGLKFGDEHQTYDQLFEGSDSLRLSLDFQVGATLSDHLLAGGWIAAVRQQADVPGGKVALQHSQYLGAVTYFPMPDGKGFFLRAGAGLAAVSAEVETGFGSIRETEYGVGMAAGFGYAFWVGKTFNLTLSNDVHFAVVAGDRDRGEPVLAWFDAIQLGFYWY